MSVKGGVRDSNPTRIVLSNSTNKIIISNIYYSHVILVVATGSECFIENCSSYAFLYNKAGCNLFAPPNFNRTVF